MISAVSRLKFTILWRRGKEKRRKNKIQHENIMVCPIPYGDHKKAVHAVAWNYRAMRGTRSESLAPT